MNTIEKNDRNTNIEFPLKFKYKIYSQKEKTSQILFKPFWMGCSELPREEKPSLVLLFVQLNDKDVNYIGKGKCFMDFPF